MKITTVGIDLAKNLVQVHGVDERGTPVFRKQLKRNQVLSFFANLTPCLIGIEACCGAHHWARQLGKLGHTVKLMAPQFVKPYVKTNKNDMADAEAICEAVSRPTVKHADRSIASAKGWTLERRARQSELIRTWRPWSKSTGPKTASGKAIASPNAYRGGVRAALRTLAQLLRDE